jgi:hypothetical protein
MAHAQQQPKVVTGYDWNDMYRPSAGDRRRQLRGPGTIHVQEHDPGGDQ